MKNNRCGKAAVWNKNVIRKMRSRLRSPAQRPIFEISLYTGERVGAIVQLRVKDVYDSKGKVLDSITFPGRTRKSSKHGIADTRQIPVHPDLKMFMENYKHDGQGFLFASSSRSGHISTRAVDKYWRKILSDYGFVGFSTHSSRRWVINQLRAAVTEISIIAETMAIDVATVRRYLDNDPVACKTAIATSQRFIGDRAYIGALATITPDKKPKGRQLTQEQKEQNQQISKRRIFIEHLIRRLKIFRVATDRFRLNPKHYSRSDLHYLRFSSPQTWN